MVRSTLLVPTTNRDLTKNGGNCSWLCYSLDGMLWVAFKIADFIFWCTKVVFFFFTKWVRKHANRQHYYCHFPLLLWQNVPISYSFLIFLSFDSHIHLSCSNNDFAMLNTRKWFWGWTITLELGNVKFWHEERLTSSIKAKKVKWRTTLLIF